MQAYTEPYDLLSKKTVDMAQTLKSLQEELMTIDYYDQRINTCTNEDLKRIMAHNRDEEIEHSAMLAGWLKQYMNGWDQQLTDYVTDGENGTLGADKDAETHYGADYNQNLSIGKL